MQVPRGLAAAVVALMQQVQQETQLDLLAVQAEQAQHLLLLDHQLPMQAAAAAVDYLQVALLEQAAAEQAAVVLTMVPMVQLTQAAEQAVAEQLQAQATQVVMVVQVL